MIILDKVLKSACVFIVAHASISYIGLPNATLVWRSHGQETASARPGRDGFGRQEVERDEEGRVKRIINYDTQGNVTHRHVYNYAPRDGSFEIMNYGADGTVERTLHRGGPKSLPWRVYHYRGRSELNMVIVYKPVRSRRGKIRGWQEWIIYESGRWLRPPLRSRSMVR